MKVAMTRVEHLRNRPSCGAGVMQLAHLERPPAKKSGKNAAYDELTEEKVSEP